MKHLLHCVREKRGCGRRWAAFVCALALLLAACACGKQAAPPASTVAPQETASPSAAPAPTAAPQETASPPAATETPAPPAVGVGSPWVDSLLAENMPAQPPEAKDDLYLHCNYADIALHAGTYYVQVYADQAAVPDYARSVIADETHAAPGGEYTDRELEQLRIFYRQAQDTDALAAAGLSGLEPWLDRIRAAQTVEELNRVLVSEDFPFSPWLSFVVSAYDISDVNNIFIYPDFLFVDDLNGAEYLQEDEDPILQQASLSVINQTTPYLLVDLLWLGVPEDQALDTLQTMFEVEEVYGQNAAYNERYLAQPFGAFSASYVNYSLDELAALCPRYPIRETIEKFGKDASPYFTVQEAGWLKTFNSVWNDDNLEALKIMTMVKLLRECEPFLDPSVYAPARQLLGEPEPDPADSALSICDRADTFALLLGKLYVADHYSEAEVSRLTELTDGLIAAFRKLAAETDWLGDASREAVLRKLDSMRLNVLCPDGGYPDFSGIELTATEDGGTLLGNYLKLKAWHNERQNARLGRDALAVSLWDTFSPSSPGCYYEPDTNSVNIMPGFPASQGYDAGTSQETLLGVYGWVVGHEISHGFDFGGAQFDANGTDSGIFDAEDLEEYLAIVDALAAYYDTIEVLPGTFAVGDRVKTEAAADLIGMQLALAVAKEIPDFDYEAFFESAARYWFMTVPGEETIELFLSDEHPLHYLRVNVNAQMYPELYETYGVQEGDGMYLPESARIRFWGR